jgi:hypothetical protein
MADEASTQAKRICKVAGCGAPVRAVGLCSAHEQRMRKYGSVDLPAPPPWLTCQIEGCGRKARTRRGALCETHYYRQYRNGRMTLREPRQQYEHSHGYVIIRCPAHPLAAQRNSAVEYQHRVVFYDAHGDGPFRCHWCTKQVGWSDMHVDHVNAVKTDNRIENLVASCPECNQWRGRDRMVAKIRERRATWIEYNGERLTAAEWAARIGISRTSLKQRLRNGWPLHLALTAPRGVAGPRQRSAD